MLSKLSDLVKCSSTRSNRVRCCRALQMFFKFCQNLSNAGKNDVTNVVQTSKLLELTSHIIYKTCCQCFVFVNTIQNCSMSNRFSRCMRNIQIRSGAEVCRSCRFRKMPKMKHLLETFGFDIVESEPSEFSKSAYDMCSWWHPQGSECESHKIEIVFKNRRHRSRLGCRRGCRDRRWCRGRHLRDASFLALGWICQIANTMSTMPCWPNGYVIEIVKLGRAHQCGQSLSNVTKLVKCFSNYVKICQMLARMMWQMLFKLHSNFTHYLQHTLPLFCFCQH